MARGASLTKTHALSTAAANDQGPCVELLLDLGANIAERDEYHNTALHYAAVAKSINAARVLVRRGGGRRAPVVSGAGGAVEGGDQPLRARRE